MSLSPDSLQANGSRTRATPEAAAQGHVQMGALRTQVEDYPAGIPRFASLIGSHPAFNVCRRFSAVRARLLLLKQDKVSRLEKSLMDTDANETRLLFLGSSRRDTNSARLGILTELDAALKDLDDFVMRNFQLGEMPSAPGHIVTSLRNWVEGHGSIAREETEFLDYGHDLFTTVKYADGATSLLKPWIQGIVVRFSDLFGKPARTSISRDEHVYIFSEPMLHLATRILIALILVAILPVPIFIMQAISSNLLRVLCTFLAMLFLLAGISCLSDARTAEIFIAAATYATVLVVFLAGEAPVA